MAVTVELKFRHILKNALIFAFLGLRTNIITTFFILLVAFPLVWFFPYTCLLYTSFKIYLEVI